MKKISSKFIIDNLEQVLSTLCTIVLVTLLTVQIISRYVFHHSLAWTEEISIILFIWSIFFACSAAVLKDKHIKVDIILSKLSFKYAKILKIFGNAVFLFFCIFMIFAFVPVVRELLRSHTMTAMTRLPQSFIYSVLPFCLILTAIRLVQSSVGLIRQKEGTIKATKAMIDFDNL